MKQLAALVAAMRLLWLGKKIVGDFAIERVEEQDGVTYAFLPVNNETESKATLSLFWNSRAGHAIVERSPAGDVDGLRRFKVLRNLGKRFEPAEGAWLSGWLGDTPEHFGLDGEENFIKLPNGTKAFLSKGQASQWVIHLHGRKASYAETLRNFQQFTEAGFTQLAISHESDPKPFGLGKSRSNLGAAEWRQIEAAVNYARENDAEEILLFGWSLGGMLVNQFLEHSDQAASISGVIFDSPLLEYRGTLQIQAGKANLPRAMVEAVVRVLQKSFILRILGFKNVAIEELSALNSPLPVSVPTLMLFSRNDGYIAMSGVYKYRELNQATKLVEFAGARHCRLYNEDKAKYQKSIADFISLIDI